MPGDRQQMRRDLMQLAAAQRGYFTAAQARVIGYSYQAQAFHADHGNWERIDRALYRLPAWPVQPDDQYVRWTVWSDERAVVSHESALAAHDLGDVNPARLHLIVPATFGRRDDAVVLHRLSLDKSDIEERDGYRVTTPPRALAESIAYGLSTDLARDALDEGTDRGVLDAASVTDAARRISTRAANRVAAVLSSVVA